MPYKSIMIDDQKETSDTDRSNLTTAPQEYGKRLLDCPGLFVSNEGKLLKQNQLL